MIAINKSDKALKKMLGEKEKLSVAFLKIAKMLLFKFDHLIAAVAGNIDILLKLTLTPYFPYTNFILIAITYPKEMTVIITAVAFWCMFAMTLSHV